MSMLQKLGKEIVMVLKLTLYFAVWIGMLMLIKKLILAQYQIEYIGLSKALIGALILSKVVLIMEHVPLGKWVERQAAIFEVICRTVLYTLGVAIVLILEKSIEGRHEHGGFIHSTTTALESADINHVYANTICVFGALMSYNVISMLREHFGVEALNRAFLSPRPSNRI